MNSIKSELMILLTCLTLLLFSSFPANAQNVNLLEGNATPQSISSDNLVLKPALPPITVTVPNGGEQWIIRKEYTVKWSLSGVFNINIEYSVDSGVSWRTIINDYPASPTHYDWIVPNLPSTNCLLRVSDSSNPAVNDVSDAFFTIYNPINLTFPNGGEKLGVGKIYDIIWQMTGIDVDSVKIEYSPDGGIDWQTLVPSILASVGKFSWTIPDNITMQALVMITDVNNSSTGVQSNTFFSIFHPISVTYPNNGEALGIGKEYELKWLSTGVDSVLLSFSTDNGTSWTAITTAKSDSANSYLWRVPGPVSQNCLFKVVQKSNPLVWGQSDKVFSMFYPVTVVLPNGGETLNAGSKFDIKWNSTGVDSIKIEYYSDKTSSWVTIVSSIDASTGIYSWTVPNEASVNVFVRISDAGNSYVTDVSDNKFSIAYLPAITIISPNGGETYYAGNLHNITWTGNFIDKIKIEYSLNNGTNWNLIASNVTSSAGSYSWTVPDTVSVKCLIRLTSMVDPTVLDISDNVFSLQRISPPTNFTASDYPNDNGHQIQLAWNLSPNDNIISGYKIYRSRIQEFKNPVDIRTFTTLDEIINAELVQTLYLGSVQNGVASYLDSIVPINEVTYYYWLQAFFENSSSEKVPSGFVTIVNDEPVSFKVESPYPNPFNPRTTIRFRIPSDCNVKITVFDILGRKAAVIKEGHMEKGTHDAIWDGRDDSGNILAGGVYIYQVSAGNYKAAGKITFLK